MHEGVLFEVFLYLLAAVIAVPIAKRFGLGSVLGYMLAGLIMGPFCLKLIGERGEDVMHIAEFGVIMMLFVVGLELQPPLLWRLRAHIFGMGSLQVIATGVIASGVAMLFGLTWQMAVASGLIMSMSSTAIVLQTLGEKQLLKTPGGQASFAVLLFQDLAVIPILALLPLLAFAPESGADHETAVGMAALPPGLKALATVGAVLAIVLAGRYGMRPVFRAIAGTRLRELFSATALLVVVGITLLMDQVGLSPALGAFVGGVVLANSEYRHELESNIEPFKGLLLGLFFIAVGAALDLRLCIEHPGLVSGLVALLLAIKLVVLATVGRLFKLRGATNLLFTLGMAQGGEFAYVLFSFAENHNILTYAVTAPLSAAVAISMAITPLLFLLHEALARRQNLAAGPAREADVIPPEDNPVIIAGFGRFGTTVGRYLRSQGIGCTVLDLDAEQVDTLKRVGLKVYYGDASREDLLLAAGAARARMLVVAVNDAERTRAIVRTARKHFPHLLLMVRVMDRSLAYELLQDGVEHVYREVFDSSLRLADDAYRLLGGRAYRAARRRHAFRERDEKKLRELAHLWGDEARFFAAARQNIREEEELLRGEPGTIGNDHAWDNSTIREEYGPRVKLE